MVFDAKQRKAFPSVTRWFMTMCAFPEVYDVLGDVDLCKKEQKPAKKAGKKKEKKSKGEKKAQPKKKAAKKAPKPKKLKHPLQGLPKSSMVLDVWKKTYVVFEDNNTIRIRTLNSRFALEHRYSNSKKDYYASMKWLKENFDTKGYSIMTCVYKYNDENTVDWLTSNKIHSYVQRLDEVRKYAFGTMNVIDRKATKGYYEVCGAWICRGTDGPKHILAAHEESETFEWETHDFEKISEEKYQYISDLWCGEKMADGAEIYDTAVFK